MADAHLPSVKSFLRLFLRDVGAGVLHCCLIKILIQTNLKEASLVQEAVQGRPYLNDLLHFLTYETKY